MKDYKENPIEKKDDNDSTYSILSGSEFKIKTVCILLIISLFVYVFGNSISIIICDHLNLLFPDARKAELNPIGHLDQCKKSSFIPLMSIGSICLASGILGGITAYSLTYLQNINLFDHTSDYQKQIYQSEHIKSIHSGIISGFIIIGVSASFIIPLFLHIIGSDIISSGKTEDEFVLTTQNYLRLSGLCLLAAIFSKNFINSVANATIRRINNLESNVTRDRNDYILHQGKIESEVKGASSEVKAATNYISAYQLFTQYDREKCKLMDNPRAGLEQEFNESHKNKLHYLLELINNSEKFINEAIKNQKNKLTYNVFKANILRQKYNLYMVLDKERGWGYLQDAYSLIRESLDNGENKFDDFEYSNKVARRNLICYSSLLLHSNYQVKTLRDIILELDEIVKSDPSSLEWITSDPDLEPIRNTEEFKLKLNEWMMR